MMLRVGIGMLVKHCSAFNHPEDAREVDPLLNNYHIKNISTRPDRLFIFVLCGELERKRI